MPDNNNNEQPPFRGPTHPGVYVEEVDYTPGDIVFDRDGNPRGVVAERELQGEWNLVSGPGYTVTTGTQWEPTELNIDAIQLAHERFLQMQERIFSESQIPMTQYIPRIERPADYITLSYSQGNLERNFSLDKLKELKIDPKLHQERFFIDGSARRLVCWPRGKGKTAALISDVYLETLCGTKKIIVYTHHREVGNYIAHEFWKLYTEQIDNVDTTRRTATVKFHNGATVKIKQFPSVMAYDLVSRVEENVSVYIDNLELIDNMEYFQSRFSGWKGRLTLFFSPVELNMEDPAPVWQLWIKGKSVFSRHAINKNMDIFMRYLNEKSE